MTVIKAFQEKKPVDDEPLVDNAVPMGKDVEAGMLDSTHQEQPDPRLIIMRARAKRASTITTLLLIATTSLVLTIGICGGFYIYKRFTEPRYQRLKAYCNVPYIDYEDQFNSNDVSHDRLTQDSDLELMSNMFSKFQEIAGEAMQRESEMMSSLPRKEFREEFEFDLNSGNYEKIHVPEFERGRNSKFIHDFHANMTGIIDLARETCFVMPLNRSVVLPPNSLFDLFQKIQSGYYTINGAQLTESYRAVETPVSDVESLGKYIAHECKDFPVYRLEKLVQGVIKRKRSVDGLDSKAFTVLDGTQPRAIEIVNIDEMGKKQI